MIDFEKPAYLRGRFGSCPEGRAAYHRDHNPVFPVDFFAPTDLHHDVHNPVIDLAEIPFELTCSLRQAKPLFKPYNLELVNRLVAQHPRVTLKQLCVMVEREKGFRVAISSMHRAQTRLGLRQKDRRGFKKGEE